MSLLPGRMYQDPANMSPNPATLAGSHAAGGEGSSGMVGTGVAFTNPATDISDDIGHRVVDTHPQGGTDLAPIPGVVTRGLFGGVRSAPAYETLREGTPFDGSHVELANRHRSVVILAPVEMMSPAVPDQLPSLRVPPISDPLGRMCANAQAVAGGGG